MTKSTGLLPWLMLLTSPILGMTAGWLVVRAAPTPRERRLKAVFFIVLWAFILGWLYPARYAVQRLGEHFQWSERMWVGVMAGFWWFYAAVTTGLIVIMLRRVLEIRGQMTGVVVKKPSRTQRVIFATVLHLAGFGWMIGWAMQSGDKISAAIIAAVMVLLGVLNVYRVTGKTGLSAMLATARHLALVFGVLLVVVNWRLDIWLAAGRGIELSEMHRLLPMWIVHVLTLALVAWAGILLAITRPKRSA